MTTPPTPGPAPRVRLPGASPSVRLFLATEAGGAVLLLAGTVLALAWANSPWSQSYEQLWATPAGLEIGGFALELDLRHWVNDALMALFFLVIGLEVTREVTTGEFRDRRAVAAPVLGALGGLLVPAVTYLLLNPEGEAARGWGVAISTDTAFVVGLLALFGPRCPDRLRLFLLTLSIVDDIGAITVMAIFYTESVVLPALVASAVVAAAIVGLRWLRMWRLPPYVIAGVVLWLAVHESGVHATIAGVLVGLVIPAHRARQRDVDRTAAYGRALREAPSAARLHVAVLAAQATVSPNGRLQRALHPWSAYVVVPLFGLANAGVPLNSETLRAAAGSPVAIGIALALVVGKPVGVGLAAGLALRTGLGVLPGRVRYTHLLGGAALAGVGFTIALFIADRAFPNEALRTQATIGILAGSLVSAVLGTVVLRVFGERSPLCSPDADEAPQSLPPRPWREPASAD